MVGGCAERDDLDHARAFKCGGVREPQRDDGRGKEVLFRP